MKIYVLGVNSSLIIKVSISLLWKILYIDYNNLLKSSNGRGWKDELNRHAESPRTLLISICPASE